MRTESAISRHSAVIAPSNARRPASIYLDETAAGQRVGSNRQVGYGRSAAQNPASRGSRKGALEGTGVSSSTKTAAVPGCGYASGN